MINTGYIPERFKTGTICIDSYEGKTFAGRLWYPRFERELKFKNLMQLIEAIDASIKSIGFPDEYSTIRRFSAGVDRVAPDSGADRDFVPENGRLATFLIKIIFLKNATWQGTITWVENGAEENFRSMREMIYLMDSALESK
jgi:hypothetical protein